MPRPRTVSLPPEEMIALGEEMIQWIKLNDPLHVSEWYRIEKMIDYQTFKNYCDMPEFSPYYEKALGLIGRKYLDKDSKIRNGIAERFLRIYFKDVRDRENTDKQEDLDRELEQKKKIIDHQSSKDLGNLISPIQDDINKDHLIMRLQHKLAELEANANKS